MSKGFDYIVFPATARLPEDWQPELAGMQVPLRHIAHAGLEAVFAASMEDPLRRWGEKARGLSLFKRDEAGNVVRDLLDVMKEYNAEPGELMTTGLATVRIAQEASRLGVARQLRGGDNQAGGLSQRHGLPPEAAGPHLKSLTQISIAYNTLRTKRRPPTEQRLRTIFRDEAHQQEAEVEVCVLRQDGVRRIGVFATGWLVDTAAATKSQPLRNAIKIMTAISASQPAESTK